MSSSQAPTPELLRLHRRYYKSRCLELRNRLVVAHLNLVRHQAGRVAKGCSASYDDLFQQGCIGLLEAVQRFNPERGYAFSTYAVTLIRGQMQHYLRDRHHLIRSPWRLRQLLVRFDELQNKRCHSGLPPLDLQDQARSLGCHKERLRMALQLRQALNLRSLDAPARESSGNESLFEAVDPRPTPQSELLVRELQDWLLQQTPDDRCLLEGLIQHQCSQRQLARQLGWPPCRVNRRLQQLRQQLRLQLNAEAASPLQRPGRSSGH